MKKHWYFILLMAVSFGLSIWAYPQLPNQVPTHWNFSGEVDGYSSKLFAVLFSPFLILFLYVLLLGVPKIDPLKENYKKFEGTHRIILYSILTFLVFVHTDIILNGLGYRVSMDWLGSAGIGVLFMILGNYMPRVKANYFVGIRTPWTLASELVWAQTHRFGGKVFFLGGLVLIASSLLPDFAHPYSMGVSLFFIIVLPIVYSYFAYKKLGK
jgi:uncharacterized membrane protein